MWMYFVFGKLQGKLQSDENEHFPGDKLLPLNAKSIFDLVEEMLQLGFFDVVKLGGQNETIGGA